MFIEKKTKLTFQNFIVAILLISLIVLAAVGVFATNDQTLSAGTVSLRYIGSSDLKGCCGYIPFGKEEALDCLLNTVDLNPLGAPGTGDKVITLSEMNEAINSYLTFYEKWFVSGSKLMKSCSESLKGPITMSSFRRFQEKTCFNSQKKLCQLKTVCDRAAAVLRRDVYTIKTKKK